MPRDAKHKHRVAKELLLLHELGADPDHDVSASQRQGRNNAWISALYPRVTSVAATDVGEPAYAWVVTVDAPPAPAAAAADPDDGNSGAAAAAPGDSQSPRRTVCPLLFGVRLLLQVEFPEGYPHTAPQLSVPVAFRAAVSAGVRAASAAAGKQSAPICDASSALQGFRLAIPRDKIALAEAAAREDVVRMEEAAARVAAPAFFERVDLFGTECQQRSRLIAECNGALENLQYLEGSSRPPAPPPPGAHPITLYVKTLTGKTILIELHSASTVGDMKVAIRRKEGIPVHEQRLIWASKQLEDERLLTDYQFNDERYTIHLVLRLRSKASPFFRLTPDGDFWAPSSSVPEHVLPQADHNTFFAPWQPAKWRRFHVGGEPPSSAASPFSSNVALNFCASVIANTGWPGRDVDDAVTVLSSAGPPEEEDFSDARRLALLEIGQWLLRSASPAPNVVWSPDNDRHWPMLFRKMVRSLLRLPLPPGGGHPHPFLPRELAVHIGGFL